MEIDQILEKLDNYYRLQDKLNGGLFNEWGVEARRRVLQIFYFVERIQILEKELTILREEWKGGLRIEMAKLDELQTFTEAFYWFAFRCRSAVRQMPGLQSFDCEGVRNVRNKLLEHPERQDSRVLINSFGYGGNQGPVLKAMRYQGEKNWKDGGVYANAREFLDNLVRKVDEVLSEPEKAIAVARSSGDAPRNRTINL